jgi:integrase
MEEIRLMPVGSNLDVERALTPAERRRLLDAADLLLSIEGKSKDRRRNKTAPVDRPSRVSARPWRNRAIIYCLIETGMRRAAVVNLNLADIDWKDALLFVKEKGGATHSYPISDQGSMALRDYMERERGGDARDMSPAFSLPAVTIRNSTGRLTPLVINQVWDRVCAVANLKGKSPHSARHAMGRHIMDKTEGYRRCRGNSATETWPTRFSMHGCRIKR